MRLARWLAVIAGAPLLLSALLPAPAAAAAPPVQVILDGKPLSLNPAPRIVDDRTLVPMRALLESMGATITWNGSARSVEAVKSDAYLRLRIDRRLACLNPDCTSAATLDVPARIIDDRTFVPVRFVSQALGARVSWDNDRRAVVIETDKEPNYQYARVEVPTVVPGQSVEGPIPLKVAGATGSHVRFMLLNPATGSGTIVAAGNDVQATYTFTPDPTAKGARLLVAMVRDASGVERYSDPITVVLAPKPEVKVTGLDHGGLIDGPITFGSDVNFVATHVKLQLLDANGGVEDLATTGPGDRFTWYPQVGHNGDKWIKATAYDFDGNAYESAPVPVRVASGHRASFIGVEEGAVLTRPTSLRVSANFPVESIRYILDGTTLGWGFTYWWKFGPELNGKHTMAVEVTAKDGTVKLLGPYNFTINATPQLWLSGIGPKQVVTEAVSLQASSNVGITSIEYWLTDDATGKRELLGRTGPADKLTWTPKASQAGNRTIQAIAQTASGQTLSSAKVSFRVFLGKVYNPVPLVAKNEFKDLAARMAVAAYQKTGMSASLQVAQAILETGWGQYVPVDKYTGQVSYNLFGIKGTGPAGSIISNTWEEYNGVTYRVDDYFRAYRSVEESWQDHKDLLLLKSWYAPFREVMANPVLGAWGLRRSGYATDSQYPVKLISIIRTNDLLKLDEIEL